MAKPKRGRATVFSPQQNQALRTALTEIKKRLGSQRAVGEAINIEQQNVARLLNDRRAGFGYATATAVARLCGFASVDTFFRKKGVAVESSTSVTEQAHARAS